MHKEKTNWQFAICSDLLILISSAVNAYIEILIVLLLQRIVILIASPTPDTHI